MCKPPAILAAPLFALLWVSGCGPKPAERRNSPPVPAAQSSVRAESPRKRSAQPETADQKPIPAVLLSEDDPDEPGPRSKFRPPDRRPKHDDQKLAAAGIHRYESKRLILYTDIDPEIAETLPPVVNHLYEALVEYFGPLPPDPEGAEFQMTGYLIGDEAAFREQGLLEGFPTLLHGKHRQNRFWLRDQRDNYYRRHLLLHECTHCFMTFVPGPLPSVWYLEGMAELFGTHRLKPDGGIEFRILPRASDDVGGWGRIEAIRRECAEGRPLTVRGVYDLPQEAFSQPEAYAWSWGLCHFLDSHPKYAARFRELGRHLQDGQFAAKFHESFADEKRNLSTEWTLFEFQVQPGYDIPRAAIEFHQGTPLAAGETRTGVIVAARGWQDIGVKVNAGDVYEITASGRFTLAEDVKPWISEPQGISYRYLNGIPLGRLMACLDTDLSEDAQEARRMHILHVEPVGKSARLTMPANGRLLFRLNDAWDELSDNDGSVTVTINQKK
jgi:hypothetical protein